MFLIILSLIILFSSYIFYMLMALIYLPKKIFFKKEKNINLNQKGLIVIPILNGSSKIELRIKNICNYCNKKNLIF